MVGQSRLQSLLSELTIDSFPRTLMLVGSSGCGKTCFTQLVSSNFNMDIRDITDILTQETIDEIYDRVEPYIYVIKINHISIREENMILKFLEEPLKNSFVVLHAETTDGILSTILSRCVTWYFESYSREDLLQFVDDESNVDILLRIATTPGKIKDLQHIDIMSLVSYADKVIHNIHLASISNTLTIANKVGFKNEKNTMNGYLFVDVLLERLHDLIVSNAEMKYTYAYMLTSELRKKLAIKNLDCKYLFEKYLIDLHQIMRSGESR